MSTLRLVDHFLIVGYDKSQTADAKGNGRGQVLWQCPPHDKKWPDDSYEVPDLISMCMPLGWKPLPLCETPSYFCSTLTLQDGKNLNFACFTMYEASLQLADDTLISLTQSGDALSTISGEVTVYCPKCLVILSSHRYPETFKQILCQLYSIGVDKSISELDRTTRLENAVATLVGYTSVKPSKIDAFPQKFQVDSELAELSFIVPRDRDTPVTGKCVLDFFHDVGMSNALQIMTAVLADCKIILFSLSFTKLTETVHAIVSLLYPLKTGAIIIPIVTASLLEIGYLSAPMSYIYGVHSSLYEDVLLKLQDEADETYLLVNLDTQKTEFPKGKGFESFSLPDHIQERVLSQLQKILHPHLEERDRAFPPESTERDRQLGERKPDTLSKLSGSCNGFSRGSSGSSLNEAARELPRELLMDKQIRAVFMQLIAHILHRYRECLVVVRVHPKPTLILDKFAFARLRPEIGMAFLEKVLSNMLFKNFISDRGTPYRKVDIMDKMIVSDSLETFSKVGGSEFFERIDDLARFLYDNETPKSNQGALVSISRNPGSNCAFPTYVSEEERKESEDKVWDQVNEGIELYRKNAASSGPPAVELKLVPCGGIGLSADSDHPVLSDPSAIQLPAVKKRLDGLFSCLKNIFDGFQAEAYAGLSAALTTVASSHYAKQQLVAWLWNRVYNKETDSLQRTELLVRPFHFLAQLLNKALEDFDNEPDHDICRTIVCIASHFYCRLTPPATAGQQEPNKQALPVQKLTTLIQGHSIWNSIEFWEYLCYRGLQKKLHAFYGSHEAPDDRTTMEIVADEIKKWNERKRLAELDASADPNYEEDAMALDESEKQNVFAQVLDIGCQMTELLVQLRTGRNRSGTGAGSSLGYFSAGVDSSHSGTGHDDDDAQPVATAGQDTKDLIRKFVDTIMSNTDCGSSRQKENAKSALISEVEAQAREINEIHVPAMLGDDPAFLPKKHQPWLLPHETFISLLPDGFGSDGLAVRMLTDAKTMAHPLDENLPYLPANGHIFLTNYRIIIVANPRHVLTCDQVLYKSFPISALLKISKDDGNLNEGHARTGKEVTFQKRKIWTFVFANFQLLRVAFDLGQQPSGRQTVGELFADRLRERRDYHYDYHLLPSFFRDSDEALMPGTGDSLDGKGSGGVLKAKKHKMFPKTKTLLTGGGGGGQKRHANSHAHTMMVDRNDHDHLDMDAELAQSTKSTRTLERVEESRLMKDYIRLELGNSPRDPSYRKTQDKSRAAANHEFNVSFYNYKYACCETYPPAVVIPATVLDSSLDTVKLFHRTHRFPCVSWRDPRHRNVLFRASCLIKPRSAFPSAFKKSSVPSTVGAKHEGMESNQPREFFRALVDCIPKSEEFDDFDLNGSLSSRKPLLSLRTRSSTLSRNSGDVHFGSPKRGKLSKLTHKVNKNMNTLTHSFGGKKGAQTGGMKSSSNLAHDAHDTSIASSHHFRGFSETAADDEDTHSLSSQYSSTGIVRPRPPTFLYILSNDTVDKGLGIHSYPHVEIVTVDVITSSHLRDSFKVLLRACCPPDAVSSKTAAVAVASGDGFFRQIEDSKWMSHLSKLICTTMQVVSLMADGKSVMLCLEDNNDMTAQVSALAQLLMDPEYRTVDGFCTLIDKEWLSFGHRFEYKTGQSEIPERGFCPTFLLFLDAVYQATLQLPSEFEFNNMFIKTIAYHHISNRFTTFLGNCDRERLRYHNVIGKEDPLKGDNSLWSYLVSMNATNTCFFNPLYTYHHDKTGHGGSAKYLSVNWRPSALDLWDFYTPESLTDANVYEHELDLELAAPSDAGSVTDKSGRAVLNASVYQLANRDAITTTLQRIMQNKAMDGQLVNVGEIYRSKTPHPPKNRASKHALKNEVDSVLLKRASDLLHTKSRSIENDRKVSSSAVAMHSFVGSKEFTSNVAYEYCEACQLLLNEKHRDRCVRCVGCEIFAHQSCTLLLPRNCSAKMSGVSISKSESFSNGNLAPTRGRDMADGRQSCAVAAGHRSNTMDGLDGRNVTKGEMYKQTRHLKQWKKQHVEYNHEDNMLRMYDPHSHSKFKELPMDQLLMVEVVRRPYSRNDVMIPNQFESFTLLRLGMQAREYFLLVRRKDDAVKWQELLTGVIGS